MSKRVFYQDKMALQLLGNFGNRIQLSGEIEPNYQVRPSVTIVFAEGETLLGVNVSG